MKRQLFVLFTLALAASVTGVVLADDTDTPAVSALALTVLDPNDNPVTTATVYGPDGHSVGVSGFDGGATVPTLNLGDSIYIVAPGFVSRHAYFGYPDVAGTSNYHLTPDTPDFDQTFINELNYKVDGRLVKPSGALYLNAPTDFDPQQIAASAERWQKRGQQVFVGVAATGSADVQVNFKNNPSDQFFAQNPGTIAYAKRTLRGSVITAVDIVFKDYNCYRCEYLNLWAVDHEIGHGLGLNHTAKAGLMSPQNPTMEISDAEGLALLIRGYRLPGNTSPDDAPKPGVTSMTKEVVTTISCSMR